MKKERPKFDEKKWIELSNQREIIMYNLRQQGVPFSERLKAVIDLNIQIDSMTLGEKAKEYNETLIELEKAKEDGDKEKESQLSLRLLDLVHPPNDKEIPIFKLIDATGINGVPNVYVNGKEKFKRLMIQKIGYKKHIKDDIYEAVIFDEAPLEKGQIIFL